MAVTYVIYASIAAAGLVLGLAMGLVLGWLWHRGEAERLRGELGRLRGLLEAERNRRHRLRAQAEARLEELRERLRETGR